MKKTLLIIAVAGLIFLAGCAKKAESIVAASAPQTNQQTSSGFESLSLYADGVEVTVENIKRENNQTILEIAINNHSFDISGLEPKDLSSFAGKKPMAYTTEGAYSGGHHANGIMIFEGDLRGEFVFGLKKDLNFKFDIE